MSLQSRHGRPGAPAVVIRGDLNGLGVVRSLGAGGITSYIVDISPRRAAFWSRFSRSAVVSCLQGSAFVNELLRLRQKLDQRPFLIPTDELAMETISENRELLQDAFLFDLPSKEMVVALSNKARFHEFAMQHGFAVPRGIVLSKIEDLGRLESFSLPMIIKPADKKRVHAGEIERVYPVQTLHEARAICGALLTEGEELVAQDWIEGPDHAITFCLFFHDAVTNRTISFVGRKLSCFPQAIGSTAICVPEPRLRAELEAVTRRFIDVSGYKGFGSLEFKWDASRGEHLIIEPTVGRTDWQEEIATLNGVNIPLLAYRLSFEMPREPEGWEPKDYDPETRLVAWRESYARERPSELSQGYDARDGYWRWTDPGPALFFYSAGLLRRVQKWHQQNKCEPVRDGLSKLLLGTSNWSSQ
jgi:predicted ATP-grasp superfamily ATP-dependent carboligase